MIWEKVILGFLDIQWEKGKHNFSAKCQNWVHAISFSFRSESMFLWYELLLEIHQNIDITHDFKVFLDPLWWQFQFIFFTCKVSYTYVRLKTNIKRLSHDSCGNVEAKMANLLVLACLHSALFLDLKIDNWFKKKRSSI